MRRPTRPQGSMFRGAELPKMLFLGAVVLVGWPMVLLFAQGPDRPAPPEPPTVPAANLPEVKADDSIEFQGLVDKVPMQARENAAYALLLAKVRDTPPAELAAASRRDLFFTHLWERPDRYRGVPVHLEGTALRVLTYEVNRSLAPSGRIYEAWVYSDENRVTPYVLAFEEPPPGLLIGADLHARVSFDGYFLKLLGYRAGDVMRGAPMLVGRLTLKGPIQPAASPMVDLRELSRRNGVLLLLAALLAYLAIRGYFSVRKALTLSKRPTFTPWDRSTTATDGPVDMAELLKTLPDEDSQETAEGPGLPPGGGQHRPR